MAHFKNDFEDPYDGFECYGECENCDYPDCDDRRKDDEEEYLESKLDDQEVILENKYKDAEPY